MPRSHDDAHAAGLNRLKQDEHSTNASRLPRRELLTKAPATGHLIDFDPIQPVLAERSRHRHKPPVDYQHAEPLTRRPGSGD